MINKKSQELLPTMESGKIHDIDEPSVLAVDTSCISIEPNTFYRPVYIRQVFGIRFVNHLTNAGLRAIGGWYSGTEILAAYEHTAHTKTSQRVPAGEEDLIEAEHAKTKERVEKVAGHNTVQPVPKSTAEDSLRSQLEATRAARRTTTLRSKAI